MIVECGKCEGKGWYVLLQFRRECDNCDGVGQVEELFESDPDEFTPGIPTYIDRQDTEPLFVFPFIDPEEYS